MASSSGTAQQQQQQQLAEYESQLSDVSDLISASGGEQDPSLASLRSDLLELIALTRAELSELGGDDAGGAGSSTIPTSSAGTDTTTDAAAESAGARFDGQEASAAPPAVTAAAPAPAAAALSLRKTDEHEQQEQPPPPASARDSTEASAAPAAAPAAAAETKKPKSKSSKSKDSSSNKDKPPSKFEIPTNLIPLESDTEPQRKHKRRTIKALKRKWKERVREAELGEKRSTWQSFVGGKKRAATAVSSKGSIFATPEDGVGARVGVVGSGRGMTDYAKRAKHG